MIRSLALTTAALVLASSSAAAQETHATIQVLRGRAVVQDEARTQTLLRSQDFTQGGPLQLEIGAGSEVEIRWPGVASMHVWGPSALRWADDAQGHVGWSFTDLAWADLEVRRGDHRLDLPGSWRTHVSASALHLRGLPSGPVELRHHAGPALMLEWHGDPTRVRPPVAVYAGSSLRLEAPAGAGQDDRSARARSGQGAWGGRQQHELAQAPPVRVQVGRGSDRTGSPEAPQRARQPEFVAPQEIVVETTPPREMQGSVAPMGSVDEPRADVHGDGHVVREAPLQVVETVQQPVQQPMEVQVPAPKVPVQVVAQDVDTVQSPQDPWRGVRTSDLTTAGPLAIQRSTGTEVRVTSSGTWKVLVDRSAPGPIWCFGPQEDVQIHPGGIVSFDADGALKLKFGKVQVSPAPAQRTLPGQD